MRLRSFQAKLQQIAANLDPSKKRVVTAHITPGGGKSIAAAVFGRALLARGVVDAVAWYTPRESLVYQAAKEDFDGRGLGLIDNKVPFFFPEDNPGYVSTYQALVSNPDLHLHAIRAQRTLLILDEVHHLPRSPEEDSREKRWSECAGRIAEYATAILAMTGTATHRDGQIMFMDYDQAGRPVADVVYGRGEAIKDGSKLYFDARHYEGDTVWDINGRKVETKIEKPVELVKKAITWKLAGNEDFVVSAVNHGMTHWLEHRQRNPRSQCLIVCQLVDIARLVYNELRRHKGFIVDLAVSADGRRSKRSMARFRGDEENHQWDKVGLGPRGKIDVLVTVGMAYEGLDVPAASHVIFHRGYEARGWIEQCIDRATRIDWLDEDKTRRNEAKREAYFFASGTPGIIAVLDAIAKEQPERVPEKREHDCKSGCNSPQEEDDLVLKSADILSISGIPVESPAERARRQVQAHFPFADILSDEQVVAVAERMREEKAARERAKASPRRIDPRRRERLRASTQKLSNQLNLIRGDDPKSPDAAGATIKRIFGKSRTVMSVRELEEVHVWLNRQLGRPEREGL